MISFAINAYVLKHSFLLYKGKNKLNFAFVPYGVALFLVNGLYVLCFMFSGVYILDR